jgi:hypothetical protein
VAVGVGLDDGHEARAGGAVLEGADVVAHGAQVHLGPGTAPGSGAGCRAVHGLALPAGVQYVEGQDVHAGDDAA